MLFGEPTYHYEMVNATMEDLLRASLSCHAGEDTISDALETAAAELNLVAGGIANAPDTDPAIIEKALSSIERRIRITKVLVDRIQRIGRDEAYAAVKESA